MSVLSSSIHNLNTYFLSWLSVISSWIPNVNMQFTSSTYPNNLLQIVPCLFKGFHSEPGIRIRPDLETLDLCIQRFQTLEVSLGCTQWCLELLMGFSQSLVWKRIFKDKWWKQIKPVIETDQTRDKNNYRCDKNAWR